MQIPRSAFAVFTAAVLAACANQALPTPPTQTPAIRSDARALASSGNVIQNPGFEQGFDGWTECKQLAVSVSKVAHSGKRSALVGTIKSPEIDGTAGICQKVTVPIAARLTFWIKATANVSTSNEWQEAVLVGATGKVLQTFYKTAASKGWKKYGYDVSGYAGQSVTLEFVVRGSGHRGDFVGQYVDDVALVGTAATPSPTPTTSPTASPTTAPTNSPTSAPTNDACAQTQAAGQAGTVNVVPFTSITTAISSGKKVCLSAYVFTSAMFSALDAAAKNGATVTVVLPLEEQSDDSGDATQLANAGASIVWDPGAPNDHPLHAKLAIVDGIAYLDGRNWDTTDVTIGDGNPNDFTAIENALNLNPTSSANLDTVKSLALQREDQFIITSAPVGGVTVEYMSESFGTDSGTLTALENAAKAGATVQVVVLSEDENASALNALKTAGAQVRLNPQSGSEKMTLISNQTTAWFGSANATSYSSTSDNYIDWGMTVTNPTVINALQSYFTQTWNSSNPF
jgi:PLD-like domain